MSQPDNLTHSSSERKDRSAALPHGEMFDLSEHLAAALDIAERLDREQESVDTTTLVAHLRIVNEDYAVNILPHRDRRRGCS